MNLREPSNEAAGAGERAALWAARMDGSELSADDRAALEAWLGEDPSHRRLLEAYRRLSSRLDRQLPELAAAGALVVPEPPRRSRSGWRPGVVFGAALAGAAALGLAVWLLRPSPMVTLTAALGQRRTVNLPDGTQVELNAGTTLLIGNSRSERRVKLVSGEACFAVAKDLTRPFTVETPAGSVRDTGTIFDVRSDTPAELEVTVVEGSVQVRGGGENRFGGPLSLGAGDHFSADAAGVSVKALSASAVDDAIAWREGRILFDGTSLRDAVAQYARYYGRKIVVAPDIAGKRVSGWHSLDDFDKFLTSLVDQLHVRVVHDPDGVIRVTAAAEPNP